MKNKTKAFLWSCLSLIVSVIILISTTLVEYPKTLDQTFLITLWVIQICSIALIFVNWPKKSRPNYDWKEIADGNCFTIIYIEKEFDEKETITGKMIVNVDFFGETLMLFPDDIISWNNQEPEVGGRYMKYGDRLLKVFN